MLCVHMSKLFRIYDDGLMIQIDMVEMQSKERQTDIFWVGVPENHQDVKDEVRNEYLRCNFFVLLKFFLYFDFL